MVTATLSPSDSTRTAALNGHPAASVERPFNITREQLAQALAGRPAEQIEQIDWFRRHCEVHALSWEKAGAKLHKPNGSPYSGNSVFQVMTGQRELTVSLEPFCDAIARYRRNVEAHVPEGGLVKTRLGGEIRTYIESLKQQWKIGFVIGANACGKSTAIHAVELNDPRVKVFRMPEGGHLNGLLPEMARKIGFGDKQTIRDLARRVIAEFGPGDVVVIDEADECFRSKTTVLGQRTLGFIRRLFDQAKCSVLLVMDPAGFAKLRTVDATDPLRRLYSRRAAPLHLPAFYESDLNLFARQHGLPPAPDHDVTVMMDGIKHTDNPRRLQNSICGSHREGLFVWLGLLSDAANLAREQRRDISWQAVLKDARVVRGNGSGGREVSEACSIEQLFAFREQTIAVIDQALRTLDSIDDRIEALRPLQPRDVQRVIDRWADEQNDVIDAITGDDATSALVIQPEGDA